MHYGRFRLSPSNPRNSACLEFSAHVVQERFARWIILSYISNAAHLGHHSCIVDRIEMLLLLLIQHQDILPLALSAKTNDLLVN